ncbi:Hypothetical protein D9617_4g000340 [Elsinoe fawcettii]|nr:Hypothetical protein D9617_4g000340 [Elsinoe fawcettii]
MPTKAKPSSTTPFKPMSVTRAVRFPPYEMQERDTTLTKDERAFLQSDWKHFKVRQYTDASHLIGDVAYMVPYNGSGQSGPTLENLHGKKRFDFFAYTFVEPTNNTEWAIMWDHETGLVRTAGIFKPLGHLKSVPKSALECSTGLLDIAANVNGGRVDIQGFWVPFDAAFELSTKFAYDIRAVLYPLFGPAILRQCIPPGNPSYQSWAIRASTVAKCRQDLLALSPSLIPSTVPRINAPQTSRPKRATKARKIQHEDTDEETASDYPASDTTTSYYRPADSPPLSPKSLPKSRPWTPVNPHPSPSPSVTSLQVASKKSTPRKAKGKTIPRSTPASSQPQRPISSSSGSPSLPLDARVRSEKAKGKQKEAPSGTKRPCPADGGEASKKRKKLEVGFVPYVPPPKQPSEREWSDIRLKQFLVREAEAKKMGLNLRIDGPEEGQAICARNGDGSGSDGKVYFSFHPVHSDEIVEDEDGQRGLWLTLPGQMNKGEGSKGGKMHLQDLKAALWLTQMWKGVEIAKYDDVEVLREAVRLRQIRMGDLEELMDEFVVDVEKSTAGNVEGGNIEGDAEGESDY